VRYYTDRVQPLEIFANDPLIHQPGTKYSYTTYGYNLLGAAVELVSGQPFTAYLKQNILTRAGMESTGPDDSFALIPHRSRGYSLASNGELRNCRLADTSNKIPGGGLIGTAADLVRFALAVQANQLLRAETVRSMFQRAALNDGSRVDYGMGWRIATDEGRDQVGHSGGQQGTSTMLLLYPKEGAAVAVMVNRDQAPAGTLANALARLLFQP
jgi:CubicO group peptidase (beta-lactamase class C family)